MYSTPERSLIPEAPRELCRWLEWCFLSVAEDGFTSLYVNAPASGRRARSTYGFARVSPKAGEYFREQLRHVEARSADAAVSDGRQVHQRHILLTTCRGLGPSPTRSIATTRHPNLKRIQARPAYQLAQGGECPADADRPVPQKPDRY